VAKQRRIVAEIEKQFSRLDEAVANLNRVKADLKRYKAAVLKAAVEGRLVETEAELAHRESRTYEPAEALLRRTANTRSETSSRTNSGKSSAGRAADLAQLPAGWTWTTPERLSAPTDGAISAGPFGTIFKAKDFRPAGIPIIFLRHVAQGRYLTDKPGFMDEQKWTKLFQNYSVFGGELLITKLGDPPGACAIYPVGIGPAMVTPDVIKMAVNNVAALPRYLMHYFNSSPARRFSISTAFGTTRLRLTLPIFRGIPIPLPPLAEQRRIVDEIDRRFSLADETEMQIVGASARAERLREAVLSESFFGNPHGRPK
jgi:type I restriction enzyme S subunit